jgi:hypothetical protein
MKLLEGTLSESPRDDANRANTKEDG